MLNELLDLPHNAKLVVSVWGEEALARVVRTGRLNADIPGTIVHVLNNALLERAVRAEFVEAIIVPQSFGLDEAYFSSTAKHKAFIVSTNPEELFYNLHNAYADYCISSPVRQKGRVGESVCVHRTAVVGEGVDLGDRVTIGPYSVVGDNISIGDGTYIGSHVVIGDDGLFWYDPSGERVHVKHMGRVQIGKNCHIQSHSVIARSCFSETATSIGDFVNVGFHVTIGHDCIIDDRCSISSNAAIAGHTSVGKECWVGLGALISNTLAVGDRASVKIGSVVVDDVMSEESVSGNFAIKHNLKLRDYMRSKRK